MKENNKDQSKPIKKLWQTPQMFLIDSGRVQSGANTLYYEVHNGNHTAVQNHAKNQSFPGNAGAYPHYHS